jgi:cytochrome c
VALALLTATLLAGPRAQGADEPSASAEEDPVFVRGRNVFGICKGCHTVKPGEASLMKGPSLYGILGRRAGSLPGYADYSEAMQRSGITWDAAKIQVYLANPKALVPGNKMAFIGLPDPGDRAAVVAYLQKVTTEAQPAESSDEQTILTLKPAK